MEVRVIGEEIVYASRVFLSEKSEKINDCMRRGCVKYDICMVIKFENEIHFISASSHLRFNTQPLFISNLCSYYCMWEPCRFTWKLKINGDISAMISHCKRENSFLPHCYYQTYANCWQDPIKRHEKSQWLGVVVSCVATGNGWYFPPKNDIITSSTTVAILQNLRWWFSSSIVLIDLFLFNLSLTFSFYLISYSLLISYHLPELWFVGISANGK